MHVPRFFHVPSAAAAPQPGAHHGPATQAHLQQTHLPGCDDTGAHAHSLSEVAIEALRDANMLSAALMLGDDKLVSGIEEVVGNLRRLHDDVMHLQEAADGAG
jgi:hypothetical protein